MISAGRWGARLMELLARVRCGFAREAEKDTRWAVDQRSCCSVGHWGVAPFRDSDGVSWLAMECAAVQA